MSEKPRIVIAGGEHATTRAIARAMLGVTEAEIAALREHAEKPKELPEIKFLAKKPKKPKGLRYSSYFNKKKR